MFMSSMRMDGEASDSTMSVPTGSTSLALLSVTQIKQQADTTAMDWGTNCTTSY